MEKNIFKFKTNINCMGFVAKVTPTLNEISEIENWEVDVQNKDKVLTIETQSLNQNEIVAAVEKAGFKIEKITN